MREEVSRMNKNMLERIKLAGEYQKKAIWALLPESAAEHVNVIEREMKQLLLEIGSGLVQEIMKPAETAASGKQEAESHVKKVTIG